MLFMGAARCMSGAGAWIENAPLRPDCECAAGAWSATKPPRPGAKSRRRGLRLFRSDGIMGLLRRGENGAARDGITLALEDWP